MTNYRRARVPGATYFFTVNLARRDTALLVERIATLREAVRNVRRRHPFVIDAMVILPDHLHAIWTLPPDDLDFPLRWRLIKTGFSRGMSCGERRRDSRIAKGERGIWQRRYWEHLIRDDVDMQRHIDNIHFNPVKHGHAARAADWPYSTIHRHIAKGWLLPSWGAASESSIDVGERS